MVCTLVCRHWWHVLDEFSLLYSADIFDDKQLFMKFMKMANRIPHRAKQVEEPVLLNTYLSSFNKQILLNTFSNLHVLTMEFESEEPDAETYFSESMHINQSISKLRILSDRLHCEVAFQVLTSNLSDRLEKLCLDFQFIQSINTHTLLDQLKNLPVLKKLTLQSLDLEINGLKNIHRHLRTIQDFSLS